MSRYDELQSLICKGKVILFVGAGVSSTLGLPNWSELIAHLADELGYNKLLFDKFGNSLELAEYYEIIQKDLNGLKKWMKSKWVVDDKRLIESKVFDHIVKMNFSIIYTTNYDHCLERAFELRGKKYKRIVDVGDLINIDPLETQIVKFHGDIDSDAPIVLTESSYFERFEFESPLDIKLKADLLGKTILFIGYSLSDVNIRLLIYKIDKLWKNSSYDKTKPKSFIFLSNPNPIQEEILKSRGIEPIVGELIDKNESINNFLEELSSCMDEKDTDLF